MITINLIIIMIIIIIIYSTTPICIYVYVYVYVCINTYVCMYIYIYIHTYITRHVGRHYCATATIHFRAMITTVPLLCYDYCCTTSAMTLHDSNILCYTLLVYDTSADTTVL